MTLAAEFSRRAEKFLKNADRVLSQRLMNAIAGLQEEPFPKGAVRVENEQFEREKVFRIRVGDY